MRGANPRLYHPCPLKKEEMMICNCGCHRPDLRFRFPEPCEECQKKKCDGHSKQNTNEILDMIGEQYPHLKEVASGFKEE